MTVSYSKHVRGIAIINGPVCQVHGGIEMKNTCEHERPGYCSQWDGTLVDEEPNCRFKEEQ